MFKNLSERLSSVFSKLTKRGALSESDVNAALREVRIALLEADVALPVVKDFVEKVRLRAVGHEVLESITPGQQVIKIVNDHLVECLSAQDSGQDGVDPHALNLKVSPPAVVFMIGLQGSGKTTFTAKIANFLQQKQNKKCLMASVDIYRPSAREQLAQLGQRCGVATVDIIEGEEPLKIARRAYQQAKIEAYDVLFIDTAGRLQIDDAMMAELKTLCDALKPTELLLAADAMMGQEAVNIAKSFQEQVGLTGIILSRVDGDARGGAALSMRHITGRPIKFVGIGEGVKDLEPFYPERIANRILDMGDIVSLVEKAAETIDQKESEALALKMEQGQFDLADMEKQLLQISKLGGMGGLMGMMPGMGKLKDRLGDMGNHDQTLKRQVAIIRSMTTKEKKHHKLINASRRKRIASGAGVQVPEVNRLLKQYQDMQQAMKRFKKLGKKGLMRHGLSSLMGRGGR